MFIKVPWSDNDLIMPVTSKETNDYFAIIAFFHWVLKLNDTTSAQWVVAFPHCQCATITIGTTTTTTPIQLTTTQTVSRSERTGGKNDGLPSSLWSTIVIIRLVMVFPFAFRRIPETDWLTHPWTASFCPSIRPHIHMELPFALVVALALYIQTIVRPHADDEFVMKCRMTRNFHTTHCISYVHPSNQPKSWWTTHSFSQWGSKRVRDAKTNWNDRWNMGQLVLLSSSRFV